MYDKLEPAHLFCGSSVVAICICNKGKVEIWLVYNKNTKLIYINVIK